MTEYGRRVVVYGSVGFVFVASGIALLAFASTNVAIRYGIGVAGVLGGLAVVLYVRFLGPWLAVLVAERGLDVIQRLGPVARPEVAALDLKDPVETGSRSRVIRRGKTEP